ncbi:MAG: hypothetical protein LBN39_12560 [Planctomycetaceae bacterium]|jgi:hypothetical protein|nr:hypothetical protein [Planctomycetaceae bacterium]
MSKITSFLFAVLFLTGSAFAAKPALPSLTVPDGLGYNIHFTDARPGELEQLAASGATIVRMDFGWWTEIEKGQYDFSAFDRLTASLEKHNIRPLYILDYSNRHYDNGLSPCSDEGRKAFAKWAAAAAVHFKDKGILWEMYNEPNIGFWKPKPNADDYIKLALETGRALREAAPDEIYIGPATSDIDIPFLEACFKGGLLEYWDAVSVHPYRQTNPETVIAEYAKLRYLIDKYAPKGKKIPILSAEWGYSTVWNNFNDERQGKYLPRQWMVNLAAEVPISIWYDWHDDGTDPKESEHHFGTTNHEYRKDQTPVYEPKPSYIAAKTFNETFKGFKYNKRLWTDDPSVYVFLFDKDNGKEVKLAAWTTAKEPKNIEIPCSLGKFGVVSYLGEKQSELSANEKGLALTVSGGAVYLTPQGSKGWWSKLAAEQSFPLAVYDATDQTAYGQTNPFSAEPYPSIAARKIGSVSIEQKSDVICPNPVAVALPIPAKNELVIKLVNSERNMSGDLRIETVNGLEPDNPQQWYHFSLKKEDAVTEIRIPLKSIPTKNYRFSIEAKVVNDNGIVRSYTIFPVRTMKLVDDFSSRNEETLNKNWSINPDGDSKVESEQSIVLDNGFVKITYKFGEGWKFVQLKPRGDLRKINGKPKTLGLLINGDGSDCSVNIRYTDSKGQTFQVHGGRLKDKKPYYFEFALDGTNVAAHWGGPNDGNINYPIEFDSIIVDGTRQAFGPSSVNVASPVLIYE